MDTLLPMAEQLDRAAAELRLNHHIHNRLAIILIDNVVELMVREALFTHTAFGGDFQGITAKHRQNARSRSLPERLSVLVFVKEFTKLESDFVRAAHEHRNSAYHEGTANEPYLRQIAFVYYEFACRYIGRFSRAFSCSSSNFEFTEIGRRYYNASRCTGDTIGTIDRTKLSQLLLAELPPPPEKSLQEELADYLEIIRAGVICNFRFLVENEKPEPNATELLAKAQFNWAREESLQKKGLENTYSGTPRRAEAVAYSKANRNKYKPKYRAVPHSSWSQAIRKVRECENPKTAFVSYHKARRNMAFLSDAIWHAAMHLYGELDQD